MEDMRSMGFVEDALKMRRPDQTAGHGRPFKQHAAQTLLGQSVGDGAPGKAGSYDEYAWHDSRD